MKLRRDYPAIAIVVIVLFVATIAGIYAVRGVLASEPQDEGDSPPTDTAIAEVDPSPTQVPVPTSTPTLGSRIQPSPTPASESKSEPTPTPTTVPLKLPPLQDKPSQPSDSPTDSPTKESLSEQDGSNEGTVYTYRDGDRTVRVVLQNDLIVQETAANTPDDVVVVKGGDDNIVRKQARHGQNARPVFRSESGGGLMTLPGGVLLMLDPEWDHTKVASFFSGNDISIERVSDLGFLQNGFIVETEPGFASLELANALASQQGVVASSPNWWREVETR